MKEIHHLPFGEHASHKGYKRTSINHNSPYGGWTTATPASQSLDGVVQAIAIFKQSDVSNSRMGELLTLWCMPAYLSCFVDSRTGSYMGIHLSKLAQVLKAKVTRQLAQDIIDSNIFVVEKDDSNKYGIGSFRPRTWFDEEGEVDSSTDCPEPSVVCQEQTLPFNTPVPACNTVPQTSHRSADTWSNQPHAQGYTPTMTCTENTETSALKTSNTAANDFAENDKISAENHKKSAEFSKKTAENHKKITEISKKTAENSKNEAEMPSKTFSYNNSLSENNKYNNNIFTDEDEKSQVHESNPSCTLEEAFEQKFMALKDYMHQQAQSTAVAQTTALLKSLIQKELHKTVSVPVNDTTTNGAFKTLMDETLRAYFKTQKIEKFMGHKDFIGILQWIKNIMNFKSGTFGHKLLKEAIDSYKVNYQEQEARNAKRKDEAMRNNHPISPFEFTDPETGTRFYLNNCGYKEMIPAQLEPRPSDEFIVHPITQDKWAPRHPNKAPLTAS